MKNTKRIILSTVVAGLLVSGGTYAEAKKPADRGPNKINVMQESATKKELEKELLKFKEEIQKLNKGKEKVLEKMEKLPEEENEELEELEQLEEELKELEEELEEIDEDEDDDKDDRDNEDDDEDKDDEKDPDKDNDDENILKHKEELEKKIQEKKEKLQEKLDEENKKVIEKSEEENKKAKEKLEKIQENKVKRLEKLYKAVMKNGNFSLDLEDELELEEELDELESPEGTVAESVYGKNEDDKKGLRKLVEKLTGKTDAKSLRKLAIIHKNLGEYEHSLEIAKNLLANDPTNKKALIISAQVLRETGKYDEAEELVNTLSTAYPELDLTAFKAILKEDQGDLEGAVEDLKEAIKNSPTEKELYKKIGSLYNTLDRKDLKIFIDGTVPEMDVEPIIESGRTLVPIRAVAETLGAEVSYDNERRMAIVQKEDTIIELPLGFNQAKVNGEVVELDVPSMVINSRLLIPLRFVAETLNAEVSYDGETKLITILDAETIEEAEIIETETTETETTN